MVMMMMMSSARSQLSPGQSQDPNNLILYYIKFQRAIPGIYDFSTSLKMGDYKKEITGLELAFEFYGAEGTGIKSLE